MKLKHKIPLIPNLNFDNDENNDVIFNSINGEIFTENHEKKGLLII